MDIVFYFVPLKRLFLDYLLFAFYLLVFIFLIPKVPFFKAAGLSNIQLISLFLLKVIAGLVYGWIQYNDTWNYFGMSIHQSDLLLTDPAQFGTDIFNDLNERGLGGFLSSRDSWWNEFHNIALVKLLAVLNIVCFDSYNVVLIFYSFLTFFGPVALYRTMAGVFPNGKLAVLIGSFFIPSFLFWSSGMHKDGMAFLGIALAIFHIHVLLQAHTFRWRPLLGVFFGLFLILVFRNYILLPFLPALAAWILSHYWKRNSLLIFIGAYLLFIAFFFASPYLSPKINLPQAVVEKQEDFMTLAGRSYVPIQKLEPTILSFAGNAPYALQLALLRPFPSDAKDFLSSLAMIETLAMLILLILFILFGEKKGTNTPMLLFCLFFSVSLLLVIGLTVNFLGAIVRYRSLALPVLFIPVLVSLQKRWKLYI